MAEVGFTCVPLCWPFSLAPVADRYISAYWFSYNPIAIQSDTYIVHIESHIEITWCNINSNYKWFIALWRNISKKAFGVSNISNRMCIMQFSIKSWQSKISPIKISSTWQNGISQANAPISLPVHSCHNILFKTLFPSFCNSLWHGSKVESKRMILRLPFSSSI